MSDSYTKLMRSLAASTICTEPLAHRWLWVIMLSQCDAKGHVFGAIPGLARIANIELADCEAALASFMSADKYSRTKEHEGRRIREIDGGWELLNHAKYSRIRGTDERREYMAEHMRAKRAKEPETLAPVSNLLAPVSSVSNELAMLAELAPLALPPDLTQTPKSKTNTRAVGAGVARPDDVSESVWSDFMDIRKKRRAPLTQTALAGICKQAGIAGITLQAALEIACARGWQSFNAEWAGLPRGSGNGPGKRSNAVQPGEPGTYGDNDELPELLR